MEILSVDVRKYLSGWPGPDHQKVEKTSRGVKTIYTAWRDESELAMVRDWLFPHHVKMDPYTPLPPIDLRQDGIDLINIWIYKDPDLPHAIVATASLIDATLHDRDNWDEGRRISNQALKSIYGMAFCRFVNGFVDRDVNKMSLTALAAEFEEVDGTSSTPASRGESSMYAHASKIGMPQRFVDLRHQATHDKMPNLQEWREATEEALEWLYERWWRRNATGDPGKAWREWNYMHEQVSSVLKEEKLGIIQWQVSDDSETLDTSKTVLQEDTAA